MDTPDKKTQPSPSSLLPKFEDSPVFSLSPIMPFNSSHSGQPFHVLGFASPQGLQSSPLTICPDESKIKSTTHVSDDLKDECSQNAGTEITSGASGALASATLHNQELDKSDSTGEITLRETNESSELVTELPESLKDDNGSPDENAVHCGTGKKPDCGFNMVGTEISLAKIIKGVSQDAGCSFENEMGVQGIPSEENKQECNWEKFINEASDILSCQTPAEDDHLEELDDESIDSGTLSFVATVLHPPNENIDGTQKLEFVCPLISSENQDVAVPFSQPGVGKSDEKSQVPATEASALLAEKVLHYSSTKAEVKSFSQQQQITRRRCLVYEMSGAHYRKLQSDPDDTSPTSEPSTNPDNFDVSRRGGNKFSSVLPGIGLHLNALAATSRDKIIVKRRTLTCRKQLISSPCTMSSFDAFTSDTRPISTQMAPDTAGTSCDEQKDAVQVTGNVDQNSIFAEAVEFHQNSPKKKRRKSENVEETESCKRCNCKRSKCLKLYCECFAAGLYCVEACNCQDCFNKPIHEETVLETRRQIESRNPLAFAPKVIKCSSNTHHGDELNTPASARHKQGCNCKKSGCLKKYCECFQGGVGCSLSCRCEGCKNAFGQKEGIEGIFEENIFRKCATSASSHNEDLAAVEENQDHATPEPSINLRARQAVRRPFHFGGIASQFPSTLQSCTTQKSDKLDETSFEEDLEVGPEDEATTAFNRDYTLPSCVTSTSPNSKRVSPPHYDLEPSPGWKSCRKLILKSISSIPTAIPEKKTTELQGGLK